MELTDTSRVQRRARLAYEWSRARQSLVGFMPVLVLVLVAALLGDRPSWTFAFGAGLFVVGSTLLWYGRDVRRAVLPGLGAGMLPLVLVLCARHVGHVCDGVSCTSLCLQACAAGGFVAGLSVSWVGNSRRAGVGYFAGAATVAVLTGAMGCSCLGLSGIAGLAAGFAAGTLPGIGRRVLAKKSV